MDFFDILEAVDRPIQARQDIKKTAKKKIKARHELRREIGPFLSLSKSRSEFETRFRLSHDKISSIIVKLDLEEGSEEELFADMFEDWEAGRLDQHGHEIPGGAEVKTLTGDYLIATEDGFEDASGQGDYSELEDDEVVLTGRSYEDGILVQANQRTAGTWEDVSSGDSIEWEYLQGDQIIGSVSLTETDWGEEILEANAPNGDAREFDVEDVEAAKEYVEKNSSIKRSNHEPRSLESWLAGPDGGRRPISPQLEEYLEELAGASDQEVGRGGYVSFSEYVGDLLENGPIRFLDEVYEIGIDELVSFAEEIKSNK